LSSQAPRALRVHAKRKSDLLAPSKNGNPHPPAPVPVPHPMLAIDLPRPLALLPPVRRVVAAVVVVAPLAQAHLPVVQPAVLQLVNRLVLPEPEPVPLPVPVPLQAVAADAAVVAAMPVPALLLAVSLVRLRTASNANLDTTTPIGVKSCA